MGSNNASWWASVGTFAGVGVASLTFFFLYLHRNAKVFIFSGTFKRFDMF